MDRTFWMSFADPDKPEGQRFLGVSIVEVSEEEASDSRAELAVSHPKHLPGAEWIAAAARVAWVMGCNPGGEIGAAEIPPEHLAKFADAPRFRLMQKPELVELGLIEKEEG